MSTDIAGMNTSYSSHTLPTTSRNEIKHKTIKSPLLDVMKEYNEIRENYICMYSTCIVLCK